MPNLIPICRAGSEAIAKKNSRPRVKNGSALSPQNVTHLFILWWYLVYRPYFKMFIFDIKITLRPHLLSLENFETRVLDHDSDSHPYSWPLPRVRVIPTPRYLSRLVATTPGDSDSETLLKTITNYVIPHTFYISFSISVTLRAVIFTIGKIIIHGIAFQASIIFTRYINSPNYMS